MAKLVTGYIINDFDNKTQKLIKKNNIDQNNNGYIEKGEELSNLLSATGKSSIYDFEDWYFPHIKESLYAGALSVGCISLAGIGGAIIPKPGFEKTIGNVVKNIAGRILASPATGFGAAFFGLGAVALFAIGCISPEKKSIGSEIIKVESPQEAQPQPVNIEPEPVEEIIKEKEIKSKFEETFKELGVPEDTELKEYVPQKGEYWISILKAKYGVNEEVAQKMANKIKEMVYDDAKAAKQTPIMYLPETWTFEGKTYNYNANAIPARTSDYSDNVKTEQGKMTKDLKYE